MIPGHLRFLLKIVGYALLAVVFVALAWPGKQPDLLPVALSLAGTFAFIWGVLALRTGNGNRRGTLTMLTLLACLYAAAAAALFSLSHWLSAEAAMQEIHAVGKSVTLEWHKDWPLKKRSDLSLWKAQFDYEMGGVISDVIDANGHLIRYVPDSAAIEARDLYVRGTQRLREHSRWAFWESWVALLLPAIGLAIGLFPGQERAEKFYTEWLKGDKPKPHSAPIKACIWILMLAMAGYFGYIILKLSVMTPPGTMWRATEPTNHPGLDLIGRSTIHYNWLLVMGVAFLLEAAMLSAVILIARNARERRPVS